jgi:Flp pilus assembly protein TadD
VHLERGRIEAVAELTRAVELSGRKDASALHWQAAALSQVGRRDEALAAQREALRLRPQDREMQEQLRAFEKTVSRNSSGAGAGAFPP